MEKYDEKGKSVNVDDDKDNERESSNENVRETPKIVVLEVPKSGRIIDVLNLAGDIQMDDSHSMSSSDIDKITYVVMHRKKAVSKKKNKKEYCVRLEVERQARNGKGKKKVVRASPNGKCLL